MKSSPHPRLAILNLLCIAALLTFGFAPFIDGDETYWDRQLRLRGKMNLPVKTLSQAKYTSCGEAVITMAYNYAYPETQITEREVIEFALAEGYYTEDQAPFTSPDDMVKIAGQYASLVSSGTVTNAEEALALLTDKLTSGDPVIIDTLSRLNDPNSGAHFVIVTGLTIDKNPNRTKIHFNDPLTGTNRSAYWLGIEGVWHGWQNNGDPGGAGWWMVLSSP